MNVLITGEKGYVARNLRYWLGVSRRDWKVVTVSVRNELPNNLSQYDVVVHAAGIVHKNKKKVQPDLYYSVNRDLTVALARRAKEQGVKQFIFISTAAVFGEDGGFDCVVIDEKTEVDPQTDYAKSKWHAEVGLLGLADDRFKVAIVRPPMIYGEDCPGNFSRLRKLAEVTIVFPMVENRRSMVHIQNICELIRLLIEHKSDGFFYPQDKEYFNTSLLVKELAARLGRKTYLSTILGVIVCKLNVSVVRKVFGSLVYARTLSDHFDGAYVVFDFFADRSQTKEH